MFPNVTPSPLDNVLQPRLLNVGGVGAAVGTDGGGVDLGDDGRAQAGRIALPPLPALTPPLRHPGRQRQGGDHLRSRHRRPGLRPSQLIIKRREQLQEQSHADRGEVVGG